MGNANHKIGNTSVHVNILKEFRKKKVAEHINRNLFCTVHFSREANKGGTMSNMLFVKFRTGCLVCWQSELAR